MKTLQDTFWDDSIPSDTVANLLSQADELIENLVKVARYALADLEGIMPEHDPSGDYEHPGWATIADLKDSIGRYTYLKELMEKHNA